MAQQQRDDLSSPASDNRAASYTERLWVPWWTWPIGVALAAFFSAEIFLGATSLVWVPYAVLIPLTIVGLFQLGRARVRVDAAGALAAGAEFRVDDAHIPVSFITEVNVLDPQAKAALLGALADAHVFTVQRPWIRTAVRIVINDPADPTPYWVVSTRRPAVLASAIVAARDAAVTATA